MRDEFLIDSHKLEFHPHRVAQWLDGRDDWEKAKAMYPLYVEISPVGACNHRCTFCAVDYLGYEPNRIEGALLRARIAEMASLGVKSVMLAGEGEPLLHKEINAITLAASGHLDVAFTTNGVLLDKLEALPLCKWVKVSINAGTRETYMAVHKAPEKDWDRVWENLEAAVKRKGDCTLGVQMVCLPQNAREEKILEKRCEDIGLDYCVFKPYSQHKKSLNKCDYKPMFFPQGEKTVVRYNAIRTERHDYEKCSATPYLWAYVMATGDVYSCSAYLKDERFNLGNLNESRFRDIWQGEKRRANWELVRSRLDIAECRVNCRMDKANRFLSAFATQKHINFI